MKKLMIEDLSEKERRYEKAYGQSNGKDKARATLAFCQGDERVRDAIVMPNTVRMIAEVWDEETARLVEAILDKAEDETSFILPSGRQTAFIWGAIRTVHAIGDITIVEYIDRRGNRMFHNYVGDQDTCCTYEKLDIALANALSYKYDGLNSQAGRYFVRMIGM